MLPLPRKLLWRLRRAGRAMAILPQIDGRVLVVGDVMEDIIVVPEGAMVRGSDVRATIRKLPGGSGANQAMWLGANDVPTAFVARVGADDLAHYACAFEARGVVPFLTGDDNLPTGRLVTLVDVDGERSFFTDRAANMALSPANLPADILVGTGLIHLSGYAFFEDGPRETVLHLMALADGADIPISIDPASTGFLAEVGASQFLEWSKGAAMCFPNREEAALLSGAEDVEDQIKILGEFYRLVVIKLGDAGAVAGNRDGIIARSAADKIEAVDTTGAGDAFLAGFVSVMIAGGSLEICLARANAAGAKAATQMGGQPG